MLYGTELHIVMTIVAKGRILGYLKDQKASVEQQIELTKTEQNAAWLRDNLKNFISLLRNCLFL